MIEVLIYNASGNETPKFETEGASGFDVRVSEKVEMAPGESVLAPTGIYLSIPRGYEGQVRLRSSMYASGAIIPISPGTIDSDYRGEVKIPLRNVSEYTVIFEESCSIAQIVISKVPTLLLKEVTKLVFESALNQTLRGCGAFGSTDK